MAGWMILWSKNPHTAPDPDRWKKSVHAAGQYGESVTEYLGAGLALATWRREHGEFSGSGQCHTRPEGDIRIAWVGQILGETGEATPAAIDLLAKPAPSFESVAAINGPFAAAVIGKHPRTVTLWTDRHGHYPIYLHRHEDTSIAATDIRCLIPWLETPALDLTAVDLLLRCGEVIDRMTLLEGVEFLPGGTCLRDDGETRKEDRYWQIEFKPRSMDTLSENAEALTRCLKRAVVRIQTACPSVGVPLSGGLDSRLCLGLCRNPAQVPSFTWGLPDCRDIRCAAAFARQVDSPHHIRLWDPSAFVPLWNPGVDRTAGNFGVHEMYVLPFVGLLGEHCDVVLNGLAGDALLGGNFIKWSWFSCDLLTLGDQTWQWRVAPEQDAWTNRLLPKFPGPTFSRQRWTASLCRRHEGRPIERLNQWLFENRVSRYTNCGTMLLRSRVESHAPFYDRDFIDRLTTVPLEQKIKHRLYLEILNRACPPAARVPWQRTNLAPVWGFWPNLASMGLHRVLRNVCKPLFIDPFPRLAVADGAGWFRRPWRAAAERILLDPRTLDRGLFDPDALRSAWAAHQQGADLTRTLGVLIAVELFARMALDHEHAPA